jgi:pyridoxamine 5'-phosphate oxidase
LVPDPSDPLALLQAWLDEAREANETWSAAFTLATATRTARPSARAVVLRGLDDRGLLFFTDSESRKGRELADNPVAAAVFLWPALRREVRLEGTVTMAGNDEADAVMAERPAEAKTPLWAWRQGEPVADAAELERRLERARASLQAGVPRPPYWVGYRLAPDVAEFWQERPHGLHERIRHFRADGGWQVQRLAP